MNDPLRTVKINDPYPPFAGKTYSVEELTPDPEVVTSLADLTMKILRQENVEMEGWLRRVSTPLIAEGYRLEELELLLSTMKWRHGKPLRVLLPRKDVNVLKLYARRQWRKFFPYRLPNGQLFNKVSKESVTL